MFADGKANPLLTKLWEQMPAKAGDKTALPAGLSAPAAPGRARPLQLQWLADHAAVLRGRALARHQAAGERRKAQVGQFSETLGFENNRPIQPVNARPVLR